jgi:hypothetical protein
MQALKALVIGMGALIIVGMGFMVYGLTNKFGAPASSKAGADAPFGTIRATMPAGATVENVEMQDGTMLVQLLMPDGGAHIMVFRLSDGRQTGTIELQPQH